MKNPDLQNNMPIDSLKFFINTKVVINYGSEKTLVFINQDKIDFSKIDELNYFQQEQEFVTLEKITDETKFNLSDRKEGFNDIEIILKEIHNITKI